MSSNEGQSRNGKLMGLLIGCAVVIIALLVTVVVLLVRGNGAGEQTTAEKRNVVVTQDNVEKVVEEMAEDIAEYVPPGNYIVTMNTEWHFADGDAVSSDARVDNDALNTNDVYFDVFLAEDESEPIYESPVIPVGGYLENIALDTPLDAGTHDCVMVYHLVDEEQNTVSTLRVAFTITVDA